MSEAHGHGEPQEQGEWTGSICANTTILAVLSIVIANHMRGNGNAVESTFVAETDRGPYTVHFHLCVQPAQRPLVS